MRLAVLADIHGNLPALESVAADLESMAPDMVVVLGDQVNRCPWSNEVMAFIAEKAWPAILGNHEIILLRMGDETAHSVFLYRRRFADLWWTWEQLTPANMAAMTELPEERRLDLPGGPPLRLLHGVKGNPFVGITTDYDDAKIDASLAGIEESYVLTAHTHWPLVRRTGRYTVMNPGSVGMSYNGDPRAHYMLLDGDGKTWRPTLCRVDYPHSRVRAAFESQGLFTAYGPMGPLYLNTIETGEPWVSDFMYWLRRQSAERGDNLTEAVEDYLAAHGPGRWAFAPLK